MGVGGGGGRSERRKPGHAAFTSALSLGEGACSSAETRPRRLLGVYAQSSALRGPASRCRTWHLSAHRGSDTIRGASSSNRQTATMGANVQRGRGAVVWSHRSHTSGRAGRGLYAPASKRAAKIIAGTRGSNTAPGQRPGQRPRGFETYYILHITY